MLRPLVALLLAAWLLAGCTGDDDDNDSASSKPSSSVSTDAVSALVQQGLDQLARGDQASASVTFENVLALDPANVYGHYNLGVIAQQAGHVKAALAAYGEALATDGAFAPALYNTALLSEPTDLEAAVDLYRKAIDADPDTAAAYMRLGFALVHLGEKDEGQKYLGEGLALDPSMADVQAPSYD